MLPAEDVPCLAPPVVVAPLMAAVPMVRSKDTCCRRRLSSENAECNESMEHSSALHQLSNKNTRRGTNGDLSKMPTSLKY